MGSSESTVGITHASRELARRESGGLRVVLLWHPHDDALTLWVKEARAGHCFELAVESNRALDAFYHPFAYAGEKAPRRPVSTNRDTDPVSLSPKSHRAGRRFESG